MEPPDPATNLQEMQVSTLNNTALHTVGNSTAFFKKDMERKKIK